MDSGLPSLCPICRPDQSTEPPPPPRLGLWLIRGEECHDDAVEFCCNQPRMLQYLTLNDSQLRPEATPAHEQPRAEN
jgi:hypothetical protein